MGDAPDLDRLVVELNRSNPTRKPATVRLEQWLSLLDGHGGSDLYLVAGLPASIRVHGSIRHMSEPPLDGDEIEESVLPSLPPHAAKSYLTKGYADASLRCQDGGRYRVNLHRERGRAAASIRALPPSPPRLEELALPANVEGLTRLPHGLVLIGGPTGSGKTTTLAALVNEINRRDAKHIVTIEDPIEYEHAHHKSIIEQVEIGIDAPDFAAALRSAV